MSFSWDEHKWTIAGSAGGALLAVLLVILAVLWCRRRTRHKGASSALGGEGTRLLQGHQEQPMRTPYQVKKDLERQEEWMKEHAADIAAAHLYLRNKPYQFAGDLTVIGRRRSDKTQILVQADDGDMFLLTVVSLRRRQRLLGLLQQPSVWRSFSGAAERLEHPLVLPVYNTELLPSSERIAFLKEWRSEGSIRDMLYLTKPEVPYERKYPVGRPAQGLELEVVAFFGRQIIEGLIVLTKAGFHYPHLTCANVMLQSRSDGSFLCRISDLENTLLGMEPSSLGNLAHFAHHTPEVQGFAEVVYEMVTGRVLDTRILPERERLLGSLPAEWRKVFEALFPERLEAESGLSLDAIRKMKPFSTCNFSCKSADIPWSRDTSLLLRQLMEPHP